jgi:membrane-associated protein
MDFLHWAADFFLHLDKHLAGIVQSYGTLTYGILFGIIFCETGLVITPFLPGDSLLFTVGALTSTKVMPYPVVIPYLLLTAAALLGDHSNYWIGRFFGNKLHRFVNKKHLDRTHEFYERHGVLTLVIAQFAPIIRTFAPFVAGVGDMTYARFAFFNLIGVACWTTLFTWGGYFFGNIGVVQKNFHYVILGIIVVSLTPIALEAWKSFSAGPPQKPSRKR